MMRALRTLVSRAIDVLVRRRRDARLDAEIQDHLARLAAEFEQRGLSPFDASLAARRAFGGIDQVKAACRDDRGWPALDALLQDCRFAWRLLWRDVRHSATIVAVLSLGIGVSHLFFTLTYAHTVRGLPMPDVANVLDLSTLDAQGSSRGVSYADFVDLRRVQTGFQDLAAYTNAAVALVEPGRPAERVDAAYTTAAAFNQSQVTAILGRVMTEHDEEPGRPAVAVIAERLWRQRFGGEGAVLGRVVEVGERPVTIVGVVSDASGFPSAAALWLPLAQMPGFSATSRTARNLRVFGRLRNDSSAASARTEIEAIGERLAEGNPDTNRNLRWRVLPIDERFLSSRAGWIPFMLAGAIVIAVAAVNVANLMLVRTARRVREFAIRTSLGATRGRLVRQLLIESCTVAMVAAAVGLLISRLGVWAHERGIPERVMPYWVRYDMDGTVWLALATVLIATLILAAVVPAIRGGRSDPISTLRDGGRSDTARHISPVLATVLLATQLALSLVLLTQVGLSTLTASVNDAPTDAVLTDPGVLTASFSLDTSRHADVEARTRFLRRAVRAIEQLPGVTSVALASHLPLGGAMERRLRLAGRETTADTDPSVWLVEVSPAYFATLRLPVLRGRALTDLDAGDGTRGVVINERFESQYFPTADALGARIALQAEPGSVPSWATVVGIVPDVRQHTARQTRPIAYLPLEPRGPVGATLLVRAPAGTAPALAEAFHALDPAVPLYQMQTLAAARWNTQWTARTSARLATVVTVATTVLAIAGLFAVVSHRIVLRTREIGIRMVLGAGPAQIVRLVAASVRGALALGLSLGLLGVLGWTRAFSPDEASSLATTGKLAVATVVALGGMVLLASAIPARWAVRLRPGEALRRDA